MVRKFFTDFREFSPILTRVGIMQIGSSGGAFTMLSSVHTGALYLRSTYAG